jgi:hypothetical protein
VKKYRWLAICLMGASVFSLAQDRYDAKDFFGAPNPLGLIDITVADPDVLVFNEKDNSQYCLNGSILLLEADNVEVTGKVIVRSFCGSQGKGKDQLQVGSGGTNQPKAPQGCGDYNVNGCDGASGGTGGDGAQGGSGTDAFFVRLRIVKVSGNGTITLASDGPEGGKGGPGGVGGNGGEGGDGKDRTCKTVCGQAGIGGDCGKGGTGGRGAQGGSSGRIEYLKSMEPLVGTKLFFSYGGGMGGFGGAGGLPGKPGSPGTGGGGGVCGGGCSGNEKGGRCGPEYAGISLEDVRGPSGSTITPVEIISLDEPYRPRTKKPMKARSK